jgi:hypothetical protein
MSKVTFKVSKPSASIKNVECSRDLPASLTDMAGWRKWIEGDDAKVAAVIVSKAIDSLVIDCQAAGRRGTTKDDIKRRAESHRFGGRVDAPAPVVIDCGALFGGFNLKDKAMLAMARAQMDALLSNGATLTNIPLELATSRPLAAK